MVSGNGDQALMVAVLAMNDLGAVLALIDCSHDFGGQRPFIDAAWFCRQASAICRVGVTTGAFVFVGGVEIGEITGGVTIPAVHELEGVGVHVVVVDIAVLDAACKRVAGLAGDRCWVAIPAPARGDGVFDLLDAAAVAGLAVAEMEGVDLAEGAAEVGSVAGREVAGERAIGGRAQQVMAGVDIMAANG